MNKTEKETLFWNGTTPLFKLGTHNTVYQYISIWLMSKTGPTNQPMIIWAVAAIMCVCDPPCLFKKAVETQRNVIF